MSICFNPVIVHNDDKVYNPVKSSINVKYVLKSRENILKSRCRKVLRKRKLKKYKLRKDGKEDQEILDVSQVFITSLNIKSPKDQIATVSSNNTNNSNTQNLQSTPNYKMGRRKKEIVKINSSDSSEVTASVAAESDVGKQDRRQMDAFKMLMDSRNKVIGCNSPGKERKEESCNNQDVIAKKELKAKRLLSLQKMALSKGSVQQQEKEEFRETYVKNKMGKRAERLKNMLSKTDQIVNRKANTLEEELNKSKTSAMNIDIISNGKDDSKSQVKSPLCNASNVTGNNTCNNNKQSMSKEEIEFLKKLSPSLKKRENMLCYFNIVTKEEDCFDDLQNELNNSSTDNVIKVKFTKKTKRKEKTKMVNNSIEQVSNIVEIPNGNTSPIKNHEVTNERHKRKRKKHINESEPATIVVEGMVETRPKRNIKKPVKYTDNVLSDTSDEDLHIFTPKKKKNIASKIESLPNNENEKVEVNIKAIDQSEKKCLKPSNHSSNSLRPIQDKKPAKLAPIFTAKTSIEEQKAKQKFLHSGIPKHVKKSLSQQVVTACSDAFQKVVHIQQISLSKERIPCIHNLSLSSYENDLDDTEIQPYVFKNFLMQDLADSNNVHNTNDKIDTLLSIMKQSYNKFPVYRTYHLLRAKSKGEFLDTNYSYLDNSIEIINSITDTCNNSADKFKWTDKYKATTSNQLIGNFESVKELKKWLISWTETDIAVKNDSDSSDFCHSDTDSGDAIRMRNNLLILTGKTGSGKTSCVYTVAMELSIKVIEVNASSKRTGKIMLQDLQEATQSHKVDRQRDFTESSQKSIDKDNNIKKKSSKQKPEKRNKQLDKKSASAKKNYNSEPFSSQDSSRTVMSLILIDDADIVFDQDEGFCSAISQLIHSSKRPVILVTETLKCPHLQKFLKYSKVLNLNPLQPKMLGTWLDIMCLAENNTCYPGLGARFLDFFQGDIRKSINCLQYYMTSQNYFIPKENVSDDIDTFDGHDNDESSSMSWAVNENHEEKIIYSHNIYDSNVQYFMSKLLNLQCHSPSLTFNVWWSLPNLLSFNLDGKKDDKSKKRCISELDAIANAVDVFSTVDLLESNTSERYNIASKPWVAPESDSLVEFENFENYNMQNEISKDISQHLMTCGLHYSQNLLNCEHKTELDFPSMMLQRDREKVVGRHKKLTSFLSPSVVLDRKAVSLDYWTFCRSICRVERAKTDSKNKRNNRFCHYLKSLNIVCRNDYFDDFCKSFNVNDSINNKSPTMDFS